MAQKILHTTAHRLADKVNRYTHKEGLEFTKLVIGMEMLLINISKLLIIYLLAAVLGMLLQTLIVHGSYILVKRFSYGLHALNSTVCTIVSCCMFVIIPWLLSGIEVSNHVVAAIFIPTIYTLYRYAPADTKARPLVGARRRVRLKKYAVACGVIAFALVLIVPDESIKFLLTLGVVL